MDHQAFHQTVLALKPSQPTKPSTLWVAVLNANIEPSQNAKEEDFLWVKCHGRIKVSTILAQYHLKHKEQGKVALKLGHRMAGEEIMMKDLTQYNDQLIVFEAVKIAEVFSRMSNIRSPLQPTNNQLTIKPDPGALHSESKGTNYDEPSESMALGRKKKSDDQKENLRLPSSVLSQKPYLSKPYRLPPQAKFSKYVPLFPGTTASTPLPSLTPPAMVTANSLPGIPPATTSTNSTAEAPTNSPLITGNPNLLTSAASNGFALYSAKLVPNLKLRRPPLSDGESLLLSTA